VVHSIRHDFFKVAAACSDEIDRARVAERGVSTFVYLIEGRAVHIIQVLRKAFLVKWTIKG
jgi:hypothetical protein